MTPENLADNLTTFCVSDYANCPDKKRSMGGCVTTLAGSPISWLSRKHRTVVLSTTETEYTDLRHCMHSMVFRKLLLQELGFATTQANVIHEDNRSCTKIGYNPELKVERHEFIVTYCNTKTIVADIFTKALDKRQFRELKAKLMLQILGAQSDQSIQ
ncbi:Hypothetical protein PHPALM_36205 [Phytophthora palmivora]|uniref:Retrovirus-related Pol polyprotein from transposon TNT 1-94 n=1 Tax=Phytophthora palmivora TaxID=4796 RepID=A0A2P4X0I2_9STRA|nr:Hypothetical protein PHPALM_36205 [Phytophthora palmivora]